MSQSDDDPPFDKLQSAKDHTDRADRLRTEAQHEIEDAIEDSLPFDAEVKTSQVRNDNQFLLEIKPVELQNMSVPMGDDEVHVYTTEPLELVVTRDALSTKRGRSEGLVTLIEDLQGEFQNGVPHDILRDQAVSMGFEESKFEHTLSELKKRGDIYEPQTNRYRSI